MFDCSFFYNCIIPIACAFITGFLTLRGVKHTIDAQKKKDRIDYIRHIKPFFVLEPINTIQSMAEHGKAIKALRIHDDTEKENSKSKKGYNKYKYYNLDPLVFSNVSDNVCIVEYLKINNEEYQCHGNISIKANETCYITGFLSFLVFKKSIHRIVIGVYDIQYHLYEFNIEYTIEDIDESVFHDGRLHKKIKFNFIDCNTGILE